MSTKIPYYVVGADGRTHEEVVAAFALKGMTKLAFLGNNDIEKDTYYYVEDNYIKYTPAKSDLAKFFKTYGQELPLVPSLEPYSKVVVREIGRSNRWSCDIYSHFEPSIGYYVCIGGREWKECLPYNDETRKLLGTSNDYKVPTVSEDVSVDDFDSSCC